MGAFVGFWIGVGFAVVGVETGRESWDNVPPLAALFGACLGIALVAWDSSKIAAHNDAELRRQRVSDEHRQAQALREQRDAQAARSAMLGQSVVRQAELGVQAYGLMPVRLDGAKDWTKRAVACYQDGAFSPFWSAMESAYDEIGLYRDAIVSVERHSQEHERLLTMIASEGGDVHGLDVFPVTLDYAHIRQTLDEATGNLSELAYQAQREPTFAMIWEQRRTTAAVVAGFNSLEAAVNGMQAALSSSLQALEGTLAENASRHERNLSGFSRAMSDSISAAQGEQIAALRHLSHRSDQIRDELHHQNWGHYPLLG